MTAFVYRNNLSLIEANLADATAQYLLKLWHREKGRMPESSSLKSLSPYLVVFDDYCDPGDSPDILFFGAETLFSKQYPEATQDPDEAPKLLLNQQYRTLVSHGYQRALDGEPVFETVGTGDLLGAGRPEVIYDRLILNFRKRVGSYLISYNIKRRETWLSPKEDHKDPTWNSQQTPDRPGLSPEELPSVSRSYAPGENHI